jgi:peptidoglycan/xylan/chitin deacetylase (PgdA/CDA1 family)
VNEDAVIINNTEPKKKKKKVKVKGKVIFLILGIVLICLLVSGYFIYINLEKNALKTLKKNYGETVITTKETDLYDKKGKKIGTIHKKMILNLTKVEKLTLKNKKLQIKDTSYYVSYKDIKKQKKKEEEVTDSYYLPGIIHIKSSKSVDLYDEKEKVITFNNGIDLDTVFADKTNYYIDFQGTMLSLKKNKSIKEEKVEKDVEGATKHVSIIYYDKITNDCSDDNCLRPESVRIHINTLKDKGFYFITKDDYYAFYNGYRNLKEKAVLLTTGEENDNTSSIATDLGVKIEKIDPETDGITLSYTNKTSTREDSSDAVNSYYAKRYTLIDDYTRMANGEEVADNGRQVFDGQSIPILNYHFFYDETIPGESEACNESICLEREKFKSHLQWLNDNGYKTLTIHEFADWMDGLIEVPYNSVLITIDDGAHGTGLHNGNVLNPLLEEYKIHATLFLISGWWDIENYRSPYLDIQSHTHWHHEEQSCGDGRGSFVCANYEEDLQDLQDSLAVIKDNTTFCFPFYSYDRESLQAISDLGFRYAFVGGNRNAKRSDNKYLIPRYPIMYDITLNEFINIVS